MVKSSINSNYCFLIDLEQKKIGYVVFIWKKCNKKHLHFREISLQLKMLKIMLLY